jgi:hypothetical protein
MGQEFLPAEIAALDLGFGQFALDHHLRGDARMVGARLPERVETAHPVPAGQHVLQRVVEGMAHMQDAGHVGRRDHDRERLGPGLAFAPALKAPASSQAACRYGPRPRCVEGLVHGSRASRLGSAVT